MKVYKKFIPLLIKEGLDRNIEYRIVEPNTFEVIIKTDPFLGNYIYWYEMVQRAHMISMSGLNRSLALGEAILNAYKSNNILNFANNLRSFIESAGDLCDALLITSSTFADNFSNLDSILNHRGKFNCYMDGHAEFESKLIHYTEGKKLSKEEKQALPDYYNAKPTYEYVSLLDGGNADKPISKLYAELCQLSHPASNSVEYFMKLDVEEKTRSYVYSFRNDQAEQLDLLITKFDKQIVAVLEMGFNPCLICLKTINKFKLEELFLDTVEQINFDLPVWLEIERKIKFRKESKQRDNL